MRSRGRTLRINIQYMDESQSLGRSSDFSKSQSLCKREEIGIFTSPITQEEVQAWNFSKSQHLYRGEEISNFLSPRVYIEADFEIFPSPRDYMKENLGIFPSLRAQGEARNFSKSQSLYRGYEIGIYQRLRDYI